MTIADSLDWAFCTRYQYILYQ